MSDPRAKVERSAAKDERQMPAPDKASTGPKRKREARPFEIWYRSGARPDGTRLFDWGRYSRYKTVELRDQVLAQVRRKHPFMEWEARDA